MRTLISRWFLFGLLLGWSLTHATVFGQSNNKTDPSANKLRAGLDKTVTVDFSGPTMESVLKHICDKAGLPVEIDPSVLMTFNGGGMPAPFQIKAKDEKTSNVLRKFLKSYQLSYAQVDGLIFITSEDQAVARQYGQRVSIDLNEVPLKKAMRDLAKNHGINLVIDPTLGIDAEREVTLQVDDTGLETALRLLAELASVKAVRMGNVMFVTNEAKAKKIREEEKELGDLTTTGRSGAEMNFRVGPIGPIPPIANPGPIYLPSTGPAPVADPIGRPVVPMIPPQNPGSKGVPTPLPPPPMVEPPAVNGVPAPTPIPRVIRN